MVADKETAVTREFTISDTASKIALITGANKGVGFEVARQIGRTRATTLVGARNQKAGQEAVSKLSAEGIHAQFMALDVTSNLDVIESTFRTNSFGTVAMTQACFRYYARQSRRVP